MGLALYRRYRPATFAEVIGQEHVTEPLQQALLNNRIHHAYLFSGPRGCGKTSCARILARSLNCAEGPTPTPCGRCDSCVALAPNGPGSLDVIEIDAASHGGVDDARDLRERAFFAPVSSRYKIYIIDEAHMVTREGFNALLRLVEEPPEHVKFVFATTEPDKVISTIRSRTFHYPFRLVPPGVLREHLAGICAREGVEVDPLVLPLVVRAGAGSVRDALSVLDQLLAGAGDEGVTYARAVALLGFTDAALLDEVVDAFAAGDGAAVLRAVDQLIEGGHDPRRFAADLLQRYRDLLVLYAVPDAAESGLLDAPPDQLERMRAQVTRFGQAALTRAAEIFNTGLTEMRGTTSPRLQLELMCARVLLPAAGTDEAAVLTRLDRLERRAAIAPSPPPGAPASPAGAAAAGARDVVVEAEPPAAAAPPAAGGDGVDGVDAAAVRRVWPDVLEAVKVRKRTTHALLSHAQVTGVDGQTLTLSFGTAPIARTFDSSVNPDVLREALREVLGVDWQLQVTVADGGPAAVEEEPSVEDSEPVVEPGPGRSRDEEALSLLEQNLGARVIDEVDAG